MSLGFKRLIDVAITNSHSLHNTTTTEKLHKYTDLKEVLTKLWQLNAVYTVPLVSSTMGIITPTPPPTPKKTPQQLDTAQSSPWSTYSHAESGNT